MTCYSVEQTECGYICVNKLTCVQNTKNEKKKKSIVLI